MLLPFRKHIRSNDFPWIVLVNGLFTDQDSWNSILESLVGFNVLTYNGRGQGDGPILKGTYSLDEQVSDLLELLNHTGLDKINIVGLSNGGRVALKFASLFPSRVTSLVACDTYGSITPLLKLKIESWLKAQEEGGPTHRFDIATPWVWGERLLKEKPELVDYYREKSREANVDNIKGLINGALSGDVDLKKIQAPTLFLVGEEDVLTPVFHHQKMKDEVKNSELQIVNGGHASLIEYPEIVKVNIGPFLRSTNELG